MKLTNRLAIILVFLFLGPMAPFVHAVEDSCRLISNTCTEGPETRKINGIEIHRECWNYEDVYTCKTGGYFDTCSGISKTCSLKSEACISTDPNTGDCTLKEKQYTCGQEISDAEAILIDSSYTITKDDINLSACQKYSDNTSCSETANVCIEGEETRIINGKSVHKMCWAWEKQYTCGADSYSNYCQPLQSICQEVSSTCERQLANGDCAIEKKTYDCATYQDEKEGIILIDEKLSIVSDTVDDSTCNDERAECALSNKVCIEGAETRVINGLPVYKDCWKYKEEFACLSGNEVSTCDSINTETCSVSKRECLLTDSAGTCTSEVVTYSCKHKTSDSTVMHCGDQMFCMGSDCYDASYTPNNELGLAAAYLGTALKSGGDVDSINDIDIFSGSKSTCTTYPLNTVDCCDDSGWANGSLSGCSNDDKKLIEERKNKLTHYVGTYCSKKLPIVKTCVEYKQSYCTYGSMLARLFQEGARPQLKMGWGSPENPSCSGVTPDQLQDVDFTKIDFTEYTDHLQVTTINNADIQKKIAEKVADINNAK